MIAEIICEKCKVLRKVVTSGNVYQCTNCGNIFELPEEQE